jgi:hypothetical protein
MTYGTSLFISKSQAQYTSPYGFSNNSALGAFSTHTNTGCINPTYGCVNSPQDPGACPAAPLDFAAESVEARTAGVKEGTAGGGCPIYTDDMAKMYQNYKLVWTPTWLAWMVNGRVMRNETHDVRTGYVPWRAMQLRPLLRTASGSVPTITGTCPAGATVCTPGSSVTVPAGLIQTMAGLLVTNNIINLAASTVTVNLTSNGMADYQFKAGSACNPCNLLSVMPTVTGQVTLTGATLNFLPASYAYIRRIKYTPWSPSNVDTSITTDQSYAWGASPPAGAMPVPQAPAPVVLPAAPYYATTATLYIAGYSVNTFPESSLAQALAESCLEGIPAANVSVVEVNAASSETVDGALDAAVTVTLMIITGNLNQLTEAFVQIDYCTAAELKASLGASVTDVKIYSAPVSVSNPSSLVPPTPVATAPPSSYTAAPSSTVTTAATLGGISSSTPTAAVQYALASSLGVPVSEVQIASFSGGSPAGRHLLSVKSKPNASVTFKVNVANSSHADSVKSDLKGGNTLERMRTNWAAAHVHAASTQGGRHLLQQTPEDLTHFRLTSEPLAGAVDLTPAYLATTFTVAGYTTSTFKQAQVDALLGVIANRLGTTPSSLVITGFTPGVPAASSVSMQVQLATTQAALATDTSVMAAFLGNSATATEAFKSAGLDAVTGVTVTSPPTSSSSALPALFSRTVAEAAISSSSMFALIGIFSSLGVALLACAFVAACMSVKHASAGRAKLAAVGARFSRKKMQAQWKTGEC